MKKFFKALLMVTCFCLIAAMTVIGVAASTPLPGDINGDGEVNLKDVVLLYRYIAGWEVTVDEDAINVNGDGSVDIDDPYHLFKYVANHQDIVIHRHNHNLTFTEAKPATKTEDGNTAYYHCPDCGKYFSDPEAKEQITLESTLLHATGSPGLNYYLNNDRASYEVGGIGTCTDTEIFIPELYNGLPVTGIGLDAFESCTKLQGITIPDSVIYIDEYAFRNCSSLTSINFPASIVHIPEGILNGCTSLSSISVSKDNPIYHSSGNCLIRTKDKTLIMGCKNSVIPNDGSVTRIARSAFYECEGLTNITIPNSITHIGEWAFYGCTDLKYYAYDNAYYLGNSSNPYLVLLKAKNQYISSCTVNPNTKFIADHAFSDCERLKNITIPDSVISIGASAFYNCIELNYNTYENVNYVGNDTNPYMVLVGVAKRTSYSYKIHPDTKIISYEAFYGCSNMSSVNIPENVISIGYNAFYNCDSLKNVKIPKSVISIGEHAFYSCDALSSIEIPSSVKNIGRYAFSRTKVSNVELPSSITSIEDGLFSSCESLTKIVIPENIVNIGSYAFSYCKSLKELYIYNNKLCSISMAMDKHLGVAGTTVIYGDEGSNAQKYAKMHKYSFIAIHGGSLGLKYELNSDGQSYAVCGIGSCTDSNIVIPDKYNNLPVTSIKYSAFAYNKDITSVIISNSVKEIESDAFRECLNLETIVFGNSVDFIGYEAFIRCKKLTSVVLHDSVKTINNGAFASCSGLKTIDLGNGVTTLGEFVFEYCTSLESIYIPKSLTNFGKLSYSYGCTVLRGCTALEVIEVEAGNPVYHSDGNCIIETQSKELIAGCKNSIIPADGTVQIIGGYAFTEHTTLESIVIPKSITNIKRCAFHYCKGMTSFVFDGTKSEWDNIIKDEDWNYSSNFEVTFTQQEHSHTPVSIPAVEATCSSTGLTEGSYCSECNEILVAQEVVPIIDHTESEWIIDKAATKTEDGSQHTECTVCHKVMQTQSIPAIGTLDLEFTLNADNESYEVTGIGTCTDTEIVIPAVYEGKPVTSIGYDAFRNCSDLTSVSIPDCVTSIGKFSFIDCSSLTSIIIPDSVTSIGDYAFCNCSGLTNITIPDSVESIGTYSFANCNNMTSISVEQGNPVYHSSGNCIIETKSKTLVAGINTSIIPADGSVTVIGEAAFCGYSGLTNITIPDCVTSIGASAFYKCSNLKSITIPNGVTSIEMCAFEGCESLTSITIPDKVTSIGYATFRNCYNLTSIIIPDSIANIGTDAFARCINLEYIEYDNGYYLGNNNNPYLVFVKAKSTSITSCEINSNTKFIYSSAFAKCINLTSITISFNITNIGYSAFSGCSSLTDVYYKGTIDDWDKVLIDSNNQNLTDARIYYYSEVAPICEGYFWHYVDGSITPWEPHIHTESDWIVDLEATLTENGSKHIECTVCHKVLNNQVIPAIASSGIEYTLNSGNESYSVKGIGVCTDTEIFILDFYNGKPVTSIEVYAFNNCSNITSIHIPNSVTSIGYSAFSGCSSLTSINIPSGVTSIGSYTFSNCSSLTNIIIPESVTIIDYAAFYQCSKLTDIIIPNNVTSIGEMAFAHCSGLSTVTIGSSVTNFGEKVFYYCSGITSITILDGVTSIGSWSFSGCSKLTSITIPDSIKSIGMYVFLDCFVLTNVTFEGTKSQWEAIEKNSSWNFAAPINVVHCTDGDVSVS